MARVLIVALLLITVPLATLAPGAGAHDGGKPLEIELEKTFWNKDTFQLSIRFPISQEDHFNIANGSYLRVTGHYVDQGGNTTGEPTQHASGVRGVVRYFSDKSCTDQNGNDPCFVDMAGVSREDLTDTRLSSDIAGGFTFETNPNAWAYGSATGSIEWDGASRYEIPEGDDQVTIRMFVSIPDAVRLDVDLHLHSPHDIELRDWNAHDGGFAYTTDDFSAPAHVDTWPVQAMTDGHQDVELPDDGSRIYAGFGPSWNGETQTSAGLTTVSVRHNTAGYSDLAFHHPNGNTRGVEGYAIGGAPIVTVAGQGMPGTYGFEVTEHVGAGPEDVYLVGWKGDTV